MSSTKLPRVPTVDFRKHDRPSDLHHKNLNKPVIKVRHSDLQRDGDSDYRSQCPVCRVGLLLMERDPVTFQLKESDRCTYCGQPFIYEDLLEIQLK